jgi:hypothetical protein
MKNMISPQEKAMITQESSIFEIGSFHQIRSLGGVIAMVISPWLVRDRNLGDFHDSPDDVEDSRNHYSQEQQEKRVIQ